MNLVCSCQELLEQASELLTAEEIAGAIEDGELSDLVRERKELAC